MRSTKITRSRNGAEYLRKLVEWLNSRPETMNENKSMLTLIAEFNKHIR